MTTTSTTTIQLLILSLFVPSHINSFATHEHIVIGGHATLTLPNGTKLLGNNTNLYFPNGNNWVTFADVVGLGGDFYGFQKYPISDAVGKQAQMVAFNNSFNTLYHDADSPCKGRFKSVPLTLTQLLLTRTNFYILLLC